MGYEIEFVDLQEQPVAVVHGHTSITEIGDFLGRAFGDVVAAVERQGGTVVGPPFGRYRQATDGELDVQAGFPVAAPVTAEGSVRPGTLPGGRAARTLHRGPYDGVAAAYEAALGWVTENHCAVSAAPWETYLDAPDVEQPRTQVFVPCRPMTPAAMPRQGRRTAQASPTEPRSL